MTQHYRGNEFEALKLRFENQTELLFRMSQIDLRVFSGYITLQLALGAWSAANQDHLESVFIRIGLLFLDLVLAIIATALLQNSYHRRKEVVETVANCNQALGYEDKGVFLDDKPLNSHTKWRAWAGWYHAGVWVGFAGIVMILFSGT